MQGLVLNTITSRCLYRASLGMTVRRTDAERHVYAVFTDACLQFTITHTLQLTLFYFIMCQFVPSVCLNAYLGILDRVLSNVSITTITITISKLCKMRSSETHDASIRAKFQLRLASQCKSQTNALTINLSFGDISRCYNTFIFIACCCSKHCCLSRLSHLMDCCSILQYNTRANIKFHIRKIIADTSKYDCNIDNDEYCHCWCINHVVCFS